MNNNEFEDLLRLAAEDSKADRAELERLESGSVECVTPELDVRMYAMFRKRKRDRIMRALTAAAAVAVAAFCTVLSLPDVLPREYLIGDAAIPEWFPVEVEEKIIMDTEDAYMAEFVSEDGREFRIVQARIKEPDIGTEDTGDDTPKDSSIDTSAGSSEGTANDEFKACCIEYGDYLGKWLYIDPRATELVYEDGGIKVHKCLETDHEGSETDTANVAEWSDGEYTYVIVGDATAEDILKMAKSAGAE